MLRKPRKKQCVQRSWSLKLLPGNSGSADDRPRRGVRRVGVLVAVALFSLLVCGLGVSAQESALPLRLGLFAPGDRAPASCDGDPEFSSELQGSVRPSAHTEFPVLLHTDPLDHAETPWFSFGDESDKGAGSEEFLAQTWEEAPLAYWEAPRVSDEDAELQDDDDPLRPTANITVEIQSDAAWFKQDERSKDAVGEIPGGAFFRRARLGVFGELYETVEYRLEFDFAGDARPRFLDNWIALTNIPIINNAIVGHFFEPFSLERYSPNRFITFMERSLTDTFVPARKWG